MKRTIRWKRISKSCTWEELRYTFLRWLNYKVAKTELGAIPPRWIRIIHFILFPLHGLYARQTQVHYALPLDYYTIRGVKIAAGLFDAISRDAEKGVKFKFIKNEDGIVTLEKINE